VLATVSILGLFKFYAVMTFLVPVMALALPLFDTIFAIVRRVARGQSPMAPDRGHLHHRLIDHGLSQKQAVAVLYSLSAMMGLTAVVICTTGKLRLLLLLVDLAIAIAVGIFVFETIEHPASEPASETKPGKPELRLVEPPAAEDAETTAEIKEKAE
jgi:UDP-GlcNAc:undecaprenyl-phosphate GlcNAc-1-phosphate transferase